MANNWSIPAADTSAAVNKMKQNDSFNEGSTCVPSSFEAPEAEVRHDFGYRSSGAASDEAFMSVESKIVAAATNKSHAELYNILSPLLEAKDTASLDSLCALHWACQAGQPELVDSLLSAGCDPHRPENINLETPIYFAIRGSNIKVVQLLVARYGTEILCHENRKRLTPFLMAASEIVGEEIQPTLHILEFLYLSGVSLEEQDGQGRTALLLACRRGSDCVVQWLMSRGANLAHRDHFGNTVLHHASHGGDKDNDTLRFVCKHGAIGLLKSKAVAATRSEETALGICLMKRKFLQYALLTVWWWEYALTGRVLAFRRMYPVYYWFVGVSSLLLFHRNYPLMEFESPRQETAVKMWMVSWISSLGLWLYTFLQDPGRARSNPVSSQAHRVSGDFESDVMKDAPKAAGPFETQLQLLEKQQGMLNYEVYRINCDSHRRGAWLVRDDFDQDLSEPLDPYGQADQDGLAQRLQVCRQEAEILQTEMHALYPQVAAERQASCAFGYPEAVLGTVSGLGVETICLTCNMVKPPRSHHCGLCGVCMIRQDHHCAWLNSCIAKNNQRSFAVFCASACVVFLHNFYTLYVHFRGAYNRGRFHWFWDSCNVVFGIAVNAVIFAFNGYITLRFVRNMVTDVTYHEYLKKPEHVKKRFQGRVTGAWWDFTGLTFFKALANCGKFWRAG